MSTTLNLYATDDATICNGYPATALSPSRKYLNVGKGSFEGDSYYWNMLWKTSLASLPSGAVVTKATFHLFNIQMYGAYDSPSLQVVPVVASWSSGTVTWNSVPGAINLPSIINVLPYNGIRPKTDIPLDVTAMVRAFIAFGYFSFRLGTIVGTGVHFMVSSIRYPSNLSYLEIEYFIPTAILTPSDFTFVDQAHPATNYNAIGLMIAGKDNASNYGSGTGNTPGDNGLCRGYFKFDLPAGSALTDAQLGAHCFFATLVNYNLDDTHLRLSPDWTAGTLTWNSQPTVTSSPEYTLFVGGPIGLNGIDLWASVLTDVTAAFAGSKKVGWQLIQHGDYASGTTENGMYFRDPVLYLAYTPPVTANALFMAGD